MVKVKDRVKVSYLIYSEHEVSAILLLLTGRHSVGDVVNIRPAAFTFPWTFF